MKPTKRRTAIRRRSGTGLPPPVIASLDDIRAILQHHAHRCADEVAADGPYATWASDEAAATRIILACWTEIVTDARHQDTAETGK